MRKNIAILFPVSRKMGVFQYGLSITEGLINYFNDFDCTILYFGSDSPKEFLKVKSLQKLEQVKFISLDSSRNNFFGKAKLFFNILIGKPLFVTNKVNKDIIKNTYIDVLIIPFPLLFGFENKIPYIVSIPDVMYKYYPSFPEYSLKNRIVFNIVFPCVMKHSLFNVVDSEYGLRDLKKFFNIPEEKIKVIPYNVPGYVYEYKNMSSEQADTLLLKYHLPPKFIFYPAQFWFHKNHLRLVESIKILRDEYQEKVNLVLVGDAMANNENYKKITDLIQKVKLETQIFHLGYVSDEEVVALYKKSYALVFPTLIGPTSVPPLEAMILGTPVLCSNLFFMPEQIGNAGLLFDPFSTKDISEKIYQLWVNDNLRKQLIINGSKKAERINMENFAKKWENIIKESLSLIHG